MSKEAPVVYGKDRGFSLEQRLWGEARRLTRMSSRRTLLRPETTDKDRVIGAYERVSKMAKSFAARLELNHHERVVFEEYLYWSFGDYSNVNRRPRVHGFEELVLDPFSRRKMIRLVEGELVVSGKGKLLIGALEQAALSLFWLTTNDGLIGEFRERKLGGAIEYFKADIADKRALLAYEPSLTSRARRGETNPMPPFDVSV